MCGLLLTAMPGYDHELALIVAELNRAALGTRASHGDTPQSTASLDQLLAYAAQRHASDLLLIAGAPVALRIDGVLSPAAGPPLGA
jgi:twitching motility protein PilT